MVNDLVSMRLFLVIHEFIKGPKLGQAIFFTALVAIMFNCMHAL